MIIKNMKIKKKYTILYILAITLFASCARMGNPDGGWFDETPPKVIGASPADRGIGVKSKNVKINFDEYVKIDNATENVIVSPPQLEAPEIKAAGKSIDVKLLDSLKANTTYTIDFSDAISDNNEGNPLGNYTYSFSTGAEIDTMEVSGYVLAADNLEPVKGILVGLYSNQADSAFQKTPMLRVSRTDSRGHFIIKGVKKGSYRIYALQDVDGNYMFNQKSEKIAFSHDPVTTSLKADVRQDTLWTDSLHIADIKRHDYTHFLPDNVTLSAFTELQTDRYLLSVTRKEANHFVTNFSYGNKELPRIKGLNFNEKNAFVVIPNVKRDTISYWLRDSALVNQDTLRMEINYLKTDSLGHLVVQNDTMEVLSKQPYEKRMKTAQKELEKWQKAQEKAKKKGDHYETVKPRDNMKLNVNVPTELDPDKNIPISVDAPLEQVDTSKIHLYTKIDTLWYKAKFAFRPLAHRDANGKLVRSDTLKYGMDYELVGEWRPGQEYSLEMDSMAFVDIYGNVSGKGKHGFKVKSNDEYSTLTISLIGMDNQHCILQLLDKSDNVVKELEAENGQAEFFYLAADDYYLRMFVDRNNNGIWDTGDFVKNIQPEEVYYYPGKIECKAKWDVRESWNPIDKPLYLQKPREITKQKVDKQKTVKRRNADRAKKLGIEYIPTGG
ncbi:Ig-like domain-containing protein [Segatella paludivivens]|uniref:Ig-like domain-containing protein n=1 Tax=Segatella paludivivens TaxID=185294 RepID=UPI0003796688